MNITNNFHGNVGQVNNVEGSGNVFIQGSDDFSALAKALRDTPRLDPKKLSSLKRELIALSKTDGLPGTVQIKMKHLLKAVEVVEKDLEPSGGKLWELLKPYVGDAQNLAAMGEIGGKLLEILKMAFVFA